MTKRIYLADHNGKQRLVRGSTPHQVRSFIARDAISVSVPSPDELYELAAKGIKIEESVPHFPT